jgi:hypothetical protein
MSISLPYLRRRITLHLAHNVKRAAQQVLRGTSCSSSGSTSCRRWKRPSRRRSTSRWSAASFPKASTAAARCRSPPCAPIGKFATPCDFALRLVGGRPAGIATWSAYPSITAAPINPRIHVMGQELTSTGVPTGIERQKRLVRYCRGYLRPSACVVPLNWP